ncbi:MAG: hypothetical protein N2512_07665 [Armatimonadetes bacterium]|nr:hypothetical protein [Armatimonadota bacterium]
MRDVAMLRALGLSALVAISGVVAQAAPAGQSAPGVQAEAVPADAVRLVLDAFFVIRMLDEKDYEERKAEVAANLVSNLRPFLVPKPAPVPAPVGTKPPGSASGAGKPAPPGAAAGASKPGSGSAGKPPAATPQTGGSPAHAKVPQKMRIRAKFASAERPYKALLQADPGQAQVVGELLRAARNAFAKGEFDVSESYVDHALRLMGVQFRQ